jgi:hypothetical protein
MPDENSGMGKTNGNASLICKKYIYKEKYAYALFTSDIPGDTDYICYTVVYQDDNALSEILAYFIGGAGFIS